VLRPHTRFSVNFFPTETLAEMISRAEVYGHWALRVVETVDGVADRQEITAARVVAD